MKIGILTTFFSKNYGAALQAYALQKKLLDMGYDVEDIRYRHVREFNAPKRYGKNIVAYFKNRIKNLNAKLRAFVKKNKEQVRNGKFDEFVERYIVLSEERIVGTDDFLSKLNSLDYDVFICGSDQIWNPIAYHFDPVYLLNFKTEARLIAYAPSIAYLDMSETEKIKMAESIQNIDNISVREESAAQLLRPYLEREILVVPDPTFLIGKEEWLSLESDIECENNFVLVYMLQYNENPLGAAEVIEKYALENGFDIVCLPYTDIKFKKVKNVKYSYDVAPNDFLKLLSKCRMLFTNSFHATALSINLNKDFYVFSDTKKHSGIESRLIELLKRFELDDRMVEPHELKKFTVINFDKANDLLIAYREVGQKFLWDSLEG